LDRTGLSVLNAAAQPSWDHFHKVDMAGNEPLQIAAAIDRGDHKV